MTLSQAISIRTRQLQGEPVGASLLAAAVETIKATTPAISPRQKATPYERTQAASNRADLACIRHFEAALKKTNP